MIKRKLVRSIQIAFFITCLTTNLALANKTSTINNQVITQQDIINSGLNNLGDILNELVISNGTVSNQFSNNYVGKSSTTVNFNSLGSSRVMVLLNGVRMVTKIDGSYDFSNIPLSIIKQVNISQDGELGINSEGISALVNIITKTDFDEIELNSYYGQSNRGDAETQRHNISFGKITDKTSIFFNAEYSKNSPILAGNRNISALPVYATGYNNNSSATPQGRFIYLDGNFNIIDVTTPLGSNGINSPNAPNIIPYTVDSSYNYAPENYLLTPQEKKSIYVNGKYNINKNTTLSSAMLFNRTESTQQFAPLPLFIGEFGDSFLRDGIFETIGIGMSNPYNPFGADLLPEYTNNGLILLGRRMVEMGNRQNINTVDSYQLDLGIDGTVGAEFRWNWSVNFRHSKEESKTRIKNQANLLNVSYALSNACVNDSSCVPLNLFGGAGSITPEMIDYIKQDSTNRQYSKMNIFNAYLSSNIFELPAGAVGFTAAYEYKSRFDERINDNNLQTDTSSYSNPDQNLRGGYNANSLLLSTYIPLFKNNQNRLFGLNIATKYDKFNQSKAEFSNGFNLNYSHNSDFNVSLNYNLIYRTPTSTELFSSGSPTFAFLSDPCEVVGSNLPGCPADIIQGTNNELFPRTFANAGNENLELEQWEKLSLNLNYRPHQIENFEIGLRLFQNRSNNTISKVSAQTIVDACAYTGYLYCDRITRDSNFTRFITEVRGGFENYARFENSGVEFNLNYAFETNYANFEIDFRNLYTTKLELSTPNLREGSNITTDFLNIESIYTETPKHLSNIAINISKNNWSLNYQLRYISGYEQACDPSLNAEIVATNDPNTVGGIVPTNFLWCTYDSPNFDSLILPSDLIEYHDRRHVGGYTIHDINIKYEFPEFKTNIILGVENIFDKTPPLSSVANNSYNTSLYNGTGRFYWLRLSKQF